jgi:DNA invertase Pin-like site-specific DNA recombinase
MKSSMYEILKNLLDQRSTAWHNSSIMKDQTKHAFAYLRVSGKGQVDGDGFPRQLVAIEAYAKANGLTLAKIFREKGITGATEWEHRPQFSEMMAAMLSNGVKTVLVERLDRCARLLMVQESIIADFQRKGLTLISVNEPDLCSDDPSRILMRQMLGAFFQYEKTLLVAKLRGARQRMRASSGKLRGGCEGRKPFGTRQGEPKIITRILALKASGMVFNSIAETLNREGLKPRKGQKWYASVVRDILVRAQAVTA